MYFFLENDPIGMYGDCHPSSAGKQIQKYISLYHTLWNLYTHKVYRRPHPQYLGYFPLLYAQKQI